jgi:hypothetical protein
MYDEYANKTYPALMKKWQEQKQGGQNPGPPPKSPWDRRMAGDYGPYIKH